jgi:hypothetical protein
MREQHEAGRPGCSPVSAGFRRVFRPYDLPYPPNAVSSPEYTNFGRIEWLKGSTVPVGERYLLEPYVKNDGVRFCPNRKDRYQRGSTWHEGRYAMNGQFSASFHVAAESAG